MKKSEAVTALERIADEIEADIDRLDAQGINVVAWGVKEGHVEVVVNPLTPAAVEYFAGRYGSQVQAFEGTATWV